MTPSFFRNGGALPSGRIARLALQARTVPLPPREPRMGRFFPAILTVLSRRHQVERDGQGWIVDGQRVTWRGLLDLARSWSGTRR